MTIAVIGGTGLTTLEGLSDVRREVVRTPYGEPSGPLVHGRLDGHALVFLPRHGRGHTIAPHRINYRANLWALRELGVEEVIAVAAVGGIGARMAPSRLAFPTQLVDYTWGRQQTYFESDVDPVTHVDFTDPYDPGLRARLLQAALRLFPEAVVDGGTYGATQGPRLETAAEIRRLARDGCDLVGMTGMPEAALARELGLRYATCAVIANWAAGISSEPITLALIEANLEVGMDRVRRTLSAALSGRSGAITVT